MKAFQSISLMILSILISSCTTGFHSQRSVEFINKSDIHKMLYSAALAGSSHNSQPWKVEVSGNHVIRLYADTTRELPVVDPKRRELYISLGAFIENLKLAAGALGYNTDVKLINDSKNNSPIAEIIPLKALPTGYDLSLIEKRMTLRTPFKTDSIAGKNIKQILAVDPQHILYFPAASNEGRYIAQKTIDAYAQQAYHKGAQDELAEWLRFSDRDVKAKKDGLTTAGMQINGLSGFFVRHFLKPKDSKKGSFIKGGIEKAKEQALNCGGWIVITSTCHLSAAWMNVGRLYQQLNLICTQLQLGFQPMNQLVEEENFKKQVISHLGIDKDLLFVARIGYVDKVPVPVSPRRPVENFTTFE